MNIDAEVVLYTDMPLVGCLPNTIGYCCFKADVAYASVSTFLRKRKTIPMAE